MEEKTGKCCWCDQDYFLNEMRESRFLGGQVCPGCDADEGSKTLGDIHNRLKQRSVESIEEGAGRVK